jgi:hypothetical protein
MPDLTPGYNLIRTLWNASGFSRPSLRAKRSNPEIKPETGLLRRCAPRNDGGTFPEHDCDKEWNNV